MKSTTCHKQTATSSMSATALISTSDAARHHRHHHNHCQPNGSASIEGRKLKLSDANNNDNNSVMSSSATTTVATKAKMPITMTNTGRSKNGEKYSLRQRQRRSFAVPTSAATVASLSSALKSEPTLVESIAQSTEGFSGYTTSVKRFNTMTVPSSSSSSSSKEKAKSKAAPLSKYRRKTANARERTRMREINSAFENLRRCVPHTITGDESTSSNEKLTKITTLRLAMKYIRVLSEALENPTFQENFLLECKNDGDHRFTTPDWVQPLEITDHSEQEIHPETPAPVQPRPKAKKSKMQMTKVFNKRQRTKTKITETLTSYLTSSPTFSSPLSSSSSSAYVSMSPSPLLDDCHSMTDLSSMILESDGESLHLSEPCLSPLSRHYNPGIQSFDGTPSLLKTTPTAIAIENPLELSLRLLEPDSDSLEFANEQPSSCISPLATLESFNPFGDLLHPDFSEHNSLDLFLT